MKYLLSWFLYGIGCVVSFIMCLTDSFSDKVYPFYNKIMLLSGDIQGKGSGPWVDCGEDEDGTG